jgi:hypothetical protein
MENKSSHIFFKNLDITFILLFATSIIIGTLMKVVILIEMASITFVFIDFFSWILISKKEDERIKLIKSKSNEISYYLIMFFCFSLTTYAIKHPNYFKDVRVLLTEILTFNCMIHSIVTAIYKRRY